MARRIVTRLHRYRRSDAPPSLWSRYANRAGSAVIVAGILVLSWLLYTYTDQYAGERMMAPVEAFRETGFSACDLIERSWQTMGLPPDFRTGDEAPVKVYLKEHPLIVALRNDETRGFWIRQGDRLVPGDASPESLRWERWTREAARRPTLQWFPPDGDNPDAGKHPVQVVTAGPWRGVKRWAIGSPEVEASLRLLLQPNYRIRVGIRPDRTAKTKEARPWGRWPNLQLDPGRLVEMPPQWLELKTNAFGSGFAMCAIPTPDEVKGFNRKYYGHLLAAGSASVTFILLLLLGFWIRTRLRRRALLESDRLASLAHSLKTPLAILKFRCDSLRLGRLTEEEADSQLLRLGQEVDHLTLIIDSGLRAIKGDREQKPTAEVTTLWVQGVASDMEAAFEAEERILSLDLCPEPGEAVLASFRSALLTLLENALEHGEGTVFLRTRKQRGQIVFTVSDEGPGLDQSALNTLGKPFQRMRSGGAEGFHREGLGLGLSLLFHTAEQEGWGLAFTSESGKGTTAELRIPAARKGPLFHQVRAALKTSPHKPLEQI